MDREIIESIISSLNSSLAEKGEYAQLNRDLYSPIRIARNNFHEIKDGIRGINNANEAKKMAFIDGGNAEILKAPNFSLQLVRTCCSIYKSNSRISSAKNEFYILINAFSEGGDILYKTQFFGLKGQFPVLGKEEINFDSFDKTLRQGEHRISISSIGAVIRRFAELERAKTAMGELDDNSILVLDGDLNGSITKESVYLNKLYEQALQKGITICALSKTSELFTEKGNALIPVLNEISPYKEWYYYPLAGIRGKSKGMPYGNCCDNERESKPEIYIAKLHKNSRYTFKVELFGRTGAKADEIFALLKSNSGDAVFLGYPYGLIEADRLARISNKETECLKTIFLIKLGKGNEKIAQYLNTLNAHSILDSLN